MRSDPNSSRKVSSPRSSCATFVALHAEFAVEDHAPSPCVGGGVADAARHGQAGEQRQFPGLQRQLRDR